MTSEERQALIKFCNTVVSDIKSDAVAHEDEIVMNTLQIFEIALAALTAHPVKLAKDLKLTGHSHQSHRDYAEGYNDRAEMDRNAIRAAGYEVQE